jgi:glucose-1-phosphate thymidylyltransferase
MEIAKAVVLAGDCRGPDPWPNLGLAARQLAPVANKPVIFHHLETLAAVGVRQAVVVTDETTRTVIPDALGDGSTWGLAISYVDGGPSPLAAPALADVTGPGAVLVQDGDVLVREPLDALCDQVSGGALDALVLHAGAHGDGNGNGNGPAAPIGYVMGPEVRDALRRAAVTDPSAGVEALLGRIRDGGARIQERVVDACLPCRGRVEALLEANRRMLEDLVPEGHGERVLDSEIQGRLALHPSAEVRDSLIRGPVAIGPGARIANAYIGPYTSIGADVHVESVEIEHSIIFYRARIRFVGARIEGSLVGPGAQIERDFRVPQAMRLSVGARAEVALS